MPVIEAHGYKFEARAHGLADVGTTFQVALHNIRQALLSLPPVEVQAMHQAGLRGDDTGLKALVDFADDRSDTFRCRRGDGDSYAGCLWLDRQTKQDHLQNRHQQQQERPGIEPARGDVAETGDGHLSRASDGSRCRAPCG